MNKLRNRLAWLAWLGLLLASGAFAQQTGRNITSTQCVTISTGGSVSTVGIVVSGTWTGTLQPQVAVAGQAPVNVSVTPAGSSTSQTTITANGTFTVGVAGMSLFQICGASVSSGTAVVDLNASTAAVKSGSASGSGVGSGASPVMAFYLSPACPVANTGQCFNTPADTQVINSCSWAGGSPAVTCAAGTFVSTDVGKTAFGYAGNCNPFAAQPLSGSLTATTVTIQTFTDSAHVNVSANAAGLAAGSGCLIFGHPDDSGFAALSTAIGSLTTAPQCPKLYLAGAGYMLTTPPSALYAQPPACTAIPALGGGGSLGNMFYAAGYEVEGRGPGATILWLVPDFPETGACNHGFGSVNCFQVALEGRWSNLQISGGSGAAGSNIPNGGVVLGVDVGSIDYVTLTNLADLASGNQHICVAAYHWVQLQQLNVSACGDIHLQVTAASQTTGYRVTLENSNSINANSSNALVTGRFVCFSCGFFNTQTATAALSSIVGVGASSITELYDPRFSTTTGTNQFFYQAITTNGPKLKIVSGKYAFTGTNGTGIFCNVTCTVDLQGVAMIGAGTKAPINITGTNSLLINRGGNTFTGGVASTFPNVLNLDSQGSVGIAAANAVLSAGWGNTPTAAWSALTGGNSFTGTITNGTAGLAASPTITYTFPTPLPVVPSICQAVQVGGTNAIGTFAATAISATGATFTFSLTPTASATEIVSIFCQ